MREIRQSGSEGGARFNPSFLPLSCNKPGEALSTRFAQPILALYAPLVPLMRDGPTVYKLWNLYLLYF